MFRRQSWKYHPNRYTFRLWFLQWFQCDECSSWCHFRSVDVFARLIPTVWDYCSRFQNPPWRQKSKWFSRAVLRGFSVDSDNIIGGCMAQSNNLQSVSTMAHGSKPGFVTFCQISRWRLFFRLIQTAPMQISEIYSVSDNCRSHDRLFTDRL